MSFTFPYVNKTVVMSTPDQPSDDKLTVVPGAEQPLYVPLSLAMQYRYANLSQLFPNHQAFVPALTAQSLPPQWLCR